MSHSVKRVTIPIAIAIALLAAPVLAGCSVQNLVHDVTGGKVDVPGKSVPKDFPGAVPLASGEVLSGAGVGDSQSKIWNVTVRVSDKNAIAAAQKAITAAGFSCVASGEGTSAGGGVVCTQGDLSVVVVQVAADSSFVLNYTVTKGGGK